jgi:hypothetical protein
VQLDINSALNGYFLAKERLSYIPGRRRGVVLGRKKYIIIPADQVETEVID